MAMVEAPLDPLRRPRRLKLYCDYYANATLEFRGCEKRFRNPYQLASKLKLGATTSDVVAPMNLTCRRCDVQLVNNRWLDNFDHADVGKIIGLEGAKDTYSKHRKGQSTHASLLTTSYSHGRGTTTCVENGVPWRKDVE